MKPSELVHKAIVELLRAHPTERHYTSELAGRMLRVEYELRQKETRGSSCSFGPARQGEHER